MPIKKRKTVTRTKETDERRATKKVVVRGKDGEVKRTKNVQKSFSNKDNTRYQPAAKGRTPALVTKTREKKDGTTVTKNISRRGTSNNLKYDIGYDNVGSVDKSKRKVTKQIQSNVKSRGAFSPQGAVGAKKRKVTKTKGDKYTKATKKVVVKGKDGTVKKTKDVFKSPSKISYGPTYVSKSKKNKDGTITNKNISRGILERKVEKTRDFPLPETKDNMFK